MKNKHIIGKVLLGGLCLMMLSQSCDKRDVFSYEADRALFFERWEHFFGYSGAIFGRLKVSFH